MEQRDYILKEIEKISILILGLLGKLKRAAGKKIFEQEREAVSEELESLTGVNIYSVISSDLNDLYTLFNRQEGFDLRNCELMADLIVEFSSNMEEEDQRKAIEKAVYLLEMVDREGRTFSFERQIKISELRKKL